MNPAQNQTLLIPNDSPYDFQSAFVGEKKKKYHWNLLLFMYKTNTQTHSPLTSVWLC